MRILVTGSKGQLGNELKSIANKYDQIFHFIDVDELDLTKSEEIIPFLKRSRPDVIINCAAYTQVDQAEDDFKLAENLNKDAPSALAEFCENFNSRLIHISTDYVFDGEFYKPVNEKSETNPLSVYGETKLKGEQKVLSISKNSYIIRTSWLYSIYGNNFVNTMIKLGEQREELSVVVDQIGTPTHAKDLANAIMIVVENLNGEKDKPGVYHFSNEGVCSWYDFAIEIFRQKNIQCKVKPISSSKYPTKAQRPFYSVLDKTKIKSNFNLDINHWADSLNDFFKQNNL